MSCTGFDVRDYFFGELPEAERASVERHMAGCAECGAELEHLQAMRGMLLFVREEDPPQRIGFVSDRIFEPSPVRRFFAEFWMSGARLGFASAAMLSCALLVFAVRQRPTVIEKLVPVASAAAPRADIDAAVAKAVNAAMIENDRKIRLMIDASERKHASDEQKLAVRVAEYTDQLDKTLQTNNKLMSANYTGGGPE